MPDRRPILYDYWRSSAAYRVRLALALKDIAHDRVSVDLVAGEQRASEHLARNPQGAVPALAIDGLMLTQSLAMLDYLDETRAAVPLLPRDAGGRARVRAIALAIACDIHPLSNLAVLERIEAISSPEARAAWNRDNISRGLAAVEKLLDHPATGRFCHGDAPGYADCVLVPQLYNARRWEVRFDHLPRIAAVSQACATLGVIASAHPDNFKPASAKTA